MPGLWKIHEFSAYYDTFKDLCFYDDLINSGGNRHVDDMLSVLPEGIRSNVRNHYSFDVYDHYIAYIAGITYCDRERFNLEFPLKLLKDPRSQQFRDHYMGWSKTAVCLAETFYSFGHRFVKYELFGRPAEYELAAHGLLLSSMEMLRLLGYNHGGIEDEKIAVQKLIEKGKHNV